MTATPSDFIAAGDFALRDNVPIGTSSVSFTGSSSKLGAPGTLQVGQRVKLDDGTNADYYRLLDAVTPKLLGGLYEWIDVGVAPHGVRAYTAASTTLTFEPYAAARANFPAVSVKQHERTSLTLTSYFEMVGGRDADLTYIAKPGGAQARFAVSGRALTILGHKPGRVTATITAYDKAQGTVVQTISVTVLPANRAPVSTRALGDPTVGVGATKDYDLATYFEDPDSDVLSWVVNGENTHVSASFSGDVMTLTALSQGDATLSVVATDPAGLHTSQQMQVLVPRNRRPARTRHVPAQALEVGGPARTVDLSQSFSDPDGGALGWLYQFEEGDPAHQYRQEVWFVASQTGSNLLYLESHFAYPPGSDAPWGAGSAWTVPAGTGYVLRTARGTDPAITRTSGTLHSAATATWDATARKVNLAIRTGGGLPLTALAAPSRLLLGVDLDVAWPEGSSGAGEGLQLNLLPGDSPGRRAGYVEVYDTRGQIASDIFQVSLGRAPVLSVAAIPAQTLIAGSDVTIDLDDYFTDPDGDEITYTVSGAPASVVALSLRHKIVVTPDALARDSVLHIHGVTAAQAVVTVTASDPDGLHLSTIFDAHVTASAVAAPPALLPPASIDRIDRLLTGEAIEAILTRVTSTTAVPFPTGSWMPIAQDSTYVLRGEDATYIDNDGNDQMRFFLVPHGQQIVAEVGKVGTTLDDRIQPGDRFQELGDARGPFEIAELLGPWNTPGDEASGLITYTDRVIMDVRLTENPRITTGSARWFWAATATPIVWLPRLTSVEHNVSFPVVPLSGTPIEVLSPTDYLRAFTAISPWDGLIAAISPDLPLSFLQEGAEFTIGATGKPVTYRIEKRLARYYRHRPVAVEMTLTALPDEAVVPTPTTPTTPTTTNRAPTVLKVFADLDATVGDAAQDYALGDYFTDPDGDALVYSVRGATSDVTATISASTLTVTPVGVTTTVTLTINAVEVANTSLEVETTLDVTVTAVPVIPNRAPTVLKGFTDLDATVGDAAQDYALGDYFADPDGDALTYTVAGATSDVTATISASTLTVTAVGAATVTLTITAADPDGLDVDSTLDVTVTAVPVVANRAPTILKGFADLDATVGDAAQDYALGDYFADPDGDALTYTVAGATSDVTATISASTLTVTAVGAATVTLTITAADPDGLDVDSTLDVTVTAAPVSGANRAPTITKQIPDLTIKDGTASSQIDLNTYFSDPDGDTLTYTSTGQIGDIYADHARGSSRWRFYGFNSGTSTTITITATDPGGLSVSQDFLITVI